MNQPQMTTTRNVTVNQGPPAVAVSDQARNDPDYKPAIRAPKTTGPPPEPGQPYHAQGWGATGTTDAPPKSAVAYRADPPADNPVPAAPPTQPEQPSPNAAPTPVASIETTPVVSTQIPEAPGDRVSALEEQVKSLGTLLSTVSTQLQQMTTFGAQSPLPGTANPNAPTPHLGSAVQGSAVPKIEGPAIPAPSKMANKYDKDAPRLPNQALMPSLQPGEEDLTQSEYIEKHFRLRDLSIDQIAWMCHMEPVDVMDILKELGYQFSDGA